MGEIIESPKQSGGWRAASGFPPVVIWAVLLAATLAVGIGGVINARRDALREAERDLIVETSGHARSIEAALASLRGDFAFLVQSAPLRDAARIIDHPDPISNRWGRLDIDATLLLFLEAHTEVDELRLMNGDAPAAVVRRRNGAPVLLPANTGEVSPDAIQGRWPVGDDSGLVVQASISPSALLASAIPGQAHRLILGTRGEAASGNVIESVRASAWEPPLDLVLYPLDADEAVTASFLRLAGRYRATLALTLSLSVLALLFGLLAYIQLRQRIEMEATRRQELRIRELERQVFHSERLASVGRLAAGIAHEINNPLEGMTNYLRLLEDDLETGQIESARELTDRLREGLDRAAGVTRQVLNFADPGRGPRSSVELNAVVRETIAFLTSKPEFRSIRIDVAPPENPVFVHGNGVTLGQVFLNLLLNACEIAPEGPIEVSYRLESDWIEVRIRDHGPGIGEDRREHLFEPFYSERGSTGLGLSICYGIVRDHGGEIEAGNDPGGGAVFLVRLPREKGRP